MTATEAKWLERIEEWKRSGLTAEQFAQGKGYRGSSLVWRHWQLNRDGQKRAPTAKAGVTRKGKKTGRSTAGVGASLGRHATIPIAQVVRAATQKRPMAGVTVEVGQARIKVDSGFDVTLLQDVVRALQEAS